MVWTSIRTRTRKFAGSYRPAPMYFKIENGIRLFWLHTDAQLRVRIFFVGSSVGTPPLWITGCNNNNDNNRYVVTFFYILSLGQQGIWDTITALGAILPRFVFRPLEESFYLHFCNSSKKGNARTDLPIIMRLSLLLGLICVCIGLPQCWSMLYIYGGEKISGNQYVKSYAQSVFEGVKDSKSGPLLLQLAFVNTCMCALNGILEGYMFAVMSADELSSHNYMLMLFSAVYLWLTMGLGRMYLAKETGSFNTS